MEMSGVQLVAMICRIGAFVFAFPFFNVNDVPMRYKILFAVAMSFCMIPVLGSSWGAGPAGAFANMTTLKMLMIVGSEIMLGLAATLLVQMAVDVFAYAGAVMDIDVGFNASQEYDPSGETRTVFSFLLSQLFIMVFLVGDMHLEMVKIVASSFQALPPGGFVLHEDVAGMMIKAVSAIFLMGLQIALPVMASMFMINLGMGILARIGEDFPVMMLSFALHLGVGIIVFTAILPTTMELCRRMGLKVLENLLLLAGGS